MGNWGSNSVTVALQASRNLLTYSLVGAPAGASIDASTGLFTWTPTEAQGPGAYTFTVRVTDTGTPPLSDERQVTVTVNEVRSSSFQGLDATDTYGLSWAYDVSADGLVVVGDCLNDTYSFRWNVATGMVMTNDLPGGTLPGTWPSPIAWLRGARGVSADGWATAGTLWDGWGAVCAQAGRWSWDTGLQGLSGPPGGGLYGGAWGISADGSVVVGESNFGSGTEAFRWTASGGMMGLGDWPGYIFESTARRVSDDGSVVVGWGYPGSTPGAAKAFRWTAAGGMRDLGDLGAEGGSMAWGVSADGSFIVGQYLSASSGWHNQAFRWTAASGMVGIGDLPGGAFESESRDVSADGSVVVGWGTTDGGQEAFIWDSAQGMRSLKYVLENDYGLDLTGWMLTRAYAVSADGRVVVGEGINPNGTIEAWRAVMNPNQPPVAEAGPDQTVNEGQAVKIAGSFTDPDLNDSHTFLWDFGDGTTTAGTLTPTHAYADNGTYAATLTVTDEYGEVGTDTMTVRVKNVPPTVSISGAPASAIAKQPITLDSSVFDPSPVDTAAGFMYRWTVMKDGSPFVSGEGTELRSFSFTPDKSGNYQVMLSAADKDGGVGTDSAMIKVIPAPDDVLSGIVWVDFNDDGRVDFGETGITGVTVNLTGVDDQLAAVNLTAQTDSDGAYIFRNLRPGTYSITEIQPADYLDGQEELGIITDLEGNEVPGADRGSRGSDLFSDVCLGEDQMGVNYNFGERPMPGSAVQRGQSATIGFWQNKNGQALIRSFDGGGTSTRLGDWLAATLPNVFGALAGANNLAGKTNDLVAGAFQARFVLKGVKLDAQVMATALAVYATNQTLGGTAATAYGFTVNTYGLGDSTWNVGSAGVAFGVVNGTTMTVMDLLLAADERARTGVLWGGDANLRKMANDVFDAINSAGRL